MNQESPQQPEPNEGSGTGLDPLQERALGELLDNAAVWVEVDADVEERVVAAIAEQAGTVERLVPSPPGRAERRYLGVIAAVAVMFLVAAVAIAVLVGGDDPVEVALAGTDEAPAASAVAQLDDTTQGLRIRLDVTGLPPAPAGKYYQGWVRNDSDGVSVGTFHMRGGDGEVELWAGVSSADYPLITVTLQTEGDGPATSGIIVLKGGG